MKTPEQKDLSRQLDNARRRLRTRKTWKLTHCHNRKRSVGVHFRLTYLAKGWEGGFTVCRIRNDDLPYSLHHVDKNTTTRHPSLESCIDCAMANCTS